MVLFAHGKLGRDDMPSSKSTSSAAFRVANPESIESSDDAFGSDADVTTGCSAARGPLSPPMPAAERYRYDHDAQTSFRIRRLACLTGLHRKEPLVLPRMKKIGDLARNRNR